MKRVQDAELIYKRHKKALMDSISAFIFLLFELLVKLFKRNSLHSYTR